MDKFQLALRSRTVQTIVVLFIIGGFQNITGYIPESLMPIISSVLGLLAIYFKVSPSQEYK